MDASSVAAVMVATGSLSGVILWLIMRIPCVRRAAQRIERWRRAQMTLALIRELEGGE